MKLYYYRDPNGNFGDDLNAWMWSKILSRDLADYHGHDDTFLGIGTLLSDGFLKQYGNKPKIIFGTGAGYGTTYSVAEEVKKANIYCVRGPLTALHFNLPQSKVVTDGALLTAALVQPTKAKKYEVALVLHHVSHEIVGAGWQYLCSQANIHYIDPTGPVEDVLSAINESRLVIAEAMHGAILADALRVPWIPIHTSPHILEFKWRDWSLSMEMNHEFIYLPSLDTTITESADGRERQMAISNAKYLVDILKKLPKQASPRLSESAVHAKKLTTLLAKIGDLEKEGLNR
ncbi:MAG: Polysaccharide pyruvyl transferase [Halothiobacillaceae bacterium]|nr:MAG: Polysaccharide pyruvyl transferase [Halothiobacillaceae bacterium]